MASAGLAWELAENTQGRFRLGLGSQVKAHVERRYGAEFSPPGPRMRDYLEAVKACLRAFRGEDPPAHAGTYYKLSLLPATRAPRRPDPGDVKLDLSAPGESLTKMAGAVDHGLPFHPLHSHNSLHTAPAPPVTPA